MSKQKRFLPLKEYTGINKDNVTGKFVARKTINKTTYSKTFSKVSNAVSWKRNFHPLLLDSEIKNSKKEKNFQELKRIQARPNGVDQRFTLKDVWELYQSNHLPMLESQSIEKAKILVRHFLPELMSLKMQEINPDVLDCFMRLKVEQAKVIGNSRRHTFNGDLKFLKTLLNWYRENYDGMFVVPVLKRHFVIGIIKKVVRKKTDKMTLEQLQLFLNSFESQFWHDFAELHFFMAGRVQEVAGLQWCCVDIQKNLIKVEDVAIWGYNDKKFFRLKEVPKNGEQRVVRLNTQMRAILQSCRINRSKIPCEFFRESTGERLNFVFERNGQPVSYRNIQYAYNNTLKRAGLFPKFSATHILRKAMANAVRHELGLDAAQVAGGWRTRSIVERIYTDAPSEQSQRIVDHIGNLLQKGPDPTQSRCN